MSALELSDPQRSRALLVGTYSYEELADLPAVENNLNELSQLLQRDDIWGLPSSNCLVLPQPTREDFLEAVDDISREAEDTLLFYYAGHGLVDPSSGELYLGLEKSSSDRLYRSAKYDDVRRLLLGANSGVPIKAHRKVVILDCCWSGIALDGFMSGKRDVATVAKISGAYVLTATAETRPALAPPGEPFTAFTGSLLDLIEEGIPDAPEFLSMDTLYEKLVLELSAKNHPVPQQRNRNGAGNICLFRNKLSDEYRQNSAVVTQELEGREAAKNLPSSSNRLPSLIRELKQTLHEPTRRIAVSELFTREADRIVNRVSDQSDFPVIGRSQSPDDYVELMRRYESESEVLLTLLTIAVYYDDELRFVDLWVRVVRRLSATRDKISGSFSDAFESLRHYPALLATETIGVSAILADREELVSRILLEPTWRSPFQSGGKKAFEYLNPIGILNGGLLQSVDAPNQQRWAFPQSHRLRQALRQPLSEIESAEENRSFAIDRFEMLASLVSMAGNSTPPENERAYAREFPWPGEFISRFGRTGGDLSQFETQVQTAWPVQIASAFGNDQGRAEQAIANLRQWIASYPAFW